MLLLIFYDKNIETLKEKGLISMPIDLGEIVLALTREELFDKILEYNDKVIALELKDYSPYIENIVKKDTSPKKRA